MDLTNRVLPRARDFEIGASDIPRAVFFPLDCVVDSSASTAIIELLAEQATEFVKRRSNECDLLLTAVCNRFLKSSAIEFCGYGRGANIDM